ncbi:MAG TPA: hypothetical protein VJT71_17370 [Pyrinomonadaceae bacterium]|nr:hypothetical protein [Pyrinomonadaceae bacterium]
MWGGIGIGLVWGCLIGGLKGVPQSNWRNILSVAVGTVLLGAGIFLIEAWRGLIAFVIAAVLAWLVGFLWRSGLRKRFATPM